MSYQYEYPRPAVTVDIIVISGLISPKILLIERLHDPFKGNWALPGGFVNEQEDLSVAAYRELKEETDIDQIVLKQFKTYGTPNRDPRGHTVSVIYFGTVEEDISFLAGDDAASAQWFQLKNLPNLAFDHELIIREFIKDYFNHQKLVL
jgi:8-oxo-dGTP diphosphatase